MTSAVCLIPWSAHMLLSPWEDRCKDQSEPGGLGLPYWKSSFQVGTTRMVQTLLSQRRKAKATHQPLAYSNLSRASLIVASGLSHDVFICFYYRS